MPEKVAVLSKIRLLLFISPKFTTCRHPRAICRKDTAVRIEADGYFLWLEKWIMQCYFVTSAVKKVSTNFPQCGVCFLSVSCLIIARCRRSGGYQNVFTGSISHHHFKNNAPQTRCFFFAMGGGDHGGSRVRHEMPWSRNIWFDIAERCA